MTPRTNGAGSGHEATAAPRSLLVAVALAVVLAGCIGAAPSVEAPAPAGGATPTATPLAEPTSTHPTMTDAPDRTPVPDKHPSLDSGLVGLVNADNRTAYANTRGLELRDGRVQVVVELVDGRDFPDGFDLTVEVRAGGRVQALVAVDDLVALAEHGNVSFVQPPSRAVPDSPSEG